MTCETSDIITPSSTAAALSPSEKEEGRRGRQMHWVIGSRRRREAKGRQNVVKVCFWADNLKLRRHIIIVKRSSCADNRKV